jgi:hypothetical protein
MKPILTRCGYRCDLCLAYKPNVLENPSNQQKLSDGWYKYFGFRLPPSEICCDGCMTDNPKLIDKNCPVRSCVIEKKLDNCSQCELYACEKLNNRFVIYDEVKSRIGKEISQDDYLCFIRPYENKRRFDTLRISKDRR